MQKLYEKILMTYMRDIGETCYRIINIRRSKRHMIYKVFTYDSDCQKTGEIELVIYVERDGSVKINSVDGTDLLKKLQEKKPMLSVSERYSQIKVSAIPRQRMEVMYA